MKSHNLLFLVIILLINCTQFNTAEDNVVDRYRKLMQSLGDSTLIAANDTSTVNPVIASLSAKYDWNTKQKQWNRNPFLLEKEETKLKPVTPKKNNTYKSNGLSLTGIIQNGSIRKALINGQLYEIGDKINNLEIIEIGIKHVTLTGANSIYKLTLKEKQ